ncbi:hypothetical protein MTO96_003664 [Rhipicephalus appendiculatus]
MRAPILAYFLSSTRCRVHAGALIRASAYFGCARSSPILLQLHDSRHIQSALEGGGGRAPKIGQFKRSALIEEEAGVVVCTSQVENSLAISRALHSQLHKILSISFSHYSRPIHASKLFAILSCA